MTLTRGERFKDARIVHNQHGKQTMDEVEAETGIKKSLIQALENDESSRDVGYVKVAALAAHYRVTTDFLLGFTNDPHPQRTAIDDLGITTAVADRFIELQNFAFLDCDFPGKINRLLENESVWHLLFLLKDYATAARADSIHDEIFPKYQHRYNEEALAQELLTIAERYRTTDVDLYDFLHAKAQSLNLSGPLANLGMEDFNLTDLLSAKISRQLAETLSSLGRGGNDGID